MPYKDDHAIIGHLGQDPELRYTNAGKAVCNLSVAVSKKINGEDKTYWYKVTVWEDLGELVAKEFVKGDPIHIEGPVIAEGWQDRTSNQIKAAVKFTAWYVARPIYAKKSGDPGKAQPREPEPPADDDSDSIPF